MDGERLVARVLSNVRAGHDSELQSGSDSQVDSKDDAHHSDCSEMVSFLIA